jgi:hypothetical protein
MQTHRTLWCFMFICGVELRIMGQFGSEYSCSIRVIHFGEAILPSPHTGFPHPPIYSPSLFQKAIIAKRPSRSRSRAIILNNCLSAVTVLSVINQAPDNRQFGVLSGISLSSCSLLQNYVVRLLKFCELRLKEREDERICSLYKKYVYKNIRCNAVSRNEGYKMGHMQEP